MIIVTQNTKNNIVTTLFELQTGSTNVYLCVFTNNSTNQNYYSVVTGTSYTTRYDTFCLTDTGNSSANPLQAQVYFPLTGQYTYKIYENSNSTNLDPTGLNMCEEGRLLVLGAEVITTSYATTATTANTVVSYNPNL